VLSDDVLWYLSRAYSSRRFVRCRSVVASVNRFWAHPLADPLAREQASVVNFAHHPGDLLCVRLRPVRRHKPGELVPVTTSLSASPTG